jgi:hypothetical protein
VKKRNGPEEPASARTTGSHQTLGAKRATSSVYFSANEVPADPVAKRRKTNRG